VALNVPPPKIFELTPVFYDVYGSQGVAYCVGTLNDKKIGA